VSQYQKSKTNQDFTEAGDIGSGISWGICKSAPRSRQITMPAPHHSVFHRPDALPADQPTASKVVTMIYILISTAINTLSPLILKNVTDHRIERGR